ncbi:MAG: TOBE domain-containing protein, partial [Kiloniellales bacterium]|nr:TOBE domain-containing protein [Kiloniellales bacterium]
GGRIAFRAFAGSSERYVVQLDDGPEIISQTSGMGSGQRFAPGDAVIVRFPAEALIVTAADAP